MDSVNRIVVPLSRIFIQMRGDAEALSREWNLEHGLEPRRVPKWTVEVLENQFTRARKLLEEKPELMTGAGDGEGIEAWNRWFERFHASIRAARNYLRGEEVAMGIVIEQIQKDVEWGMGEIDRHMKSHYSQTQNQLEELETGLQLILIAVVLLSLSLLWFGERALRPLAEITRVAREITQRGLHKKDKGRWPELSLARDDEVGQLSREFHAMATALLEREQLVEQQKERLQEQNRLLKEMGEIKIKLQESEHMATLGRLSAQVAHEVRNPLHSIGLEAEMALTYLSSGEKAAAGMPAAKTSIQSILESVRRLNSITDNYLKFARTSSGERRVVDLSEVLDRVLAAYGTSCQAKGARVDWKRPHQADLRVVGDADLLEQAFGNLFRNAIQAVPEGEGRIEWTLERSADGKVRVLIADNGPGVPAEVREKLFTPFLTTKAQGTGIGLPFVKKVVDEHSGSIALMDSSAGACFEMRFPAIAKSVDASVDARAEAPR